MRRPRLAVTAAALLAAALLVLACGSSGSSPAPLAKMAPKTVTIRG